MEGIGRGRGREIGDDGRQRKEKRNGRRYGVKERGGA